MVTDKDIAHCVESLLRRAGPAAAACATADVVLRQLEASFGFDLSHKEAFIQDQIHLHRDLLKDRFALQSVPHFQHPNAHHLAAAAAASPFAQLPHRHDLAFQYPSPPLQPSVAATGVHHQQQLRLQPHSLVVPPADASLGVFPSASVRAAAASSATPAPKVSAPSGLKRRGGPGGLSKVCGVSPELQAIVGEPTMARTEIVKQLWAYIRKNNLQDPNNKRKIICNDELRLVFETDCTDMFKMNKLLSKHIIPLEHSKNSGPDSKRSKVETSKVVSENEPEADQFTVVISDALAMFLATGDREMPQSEVLKHVWDYIKVNQLEVNDPMNTTVILCDSKLQQLFGCESISAFGMPEMLARHMFKKS